MSGIDPIKLLRYGPLGLGCLLALLAYTLLIIEQKKPNPRPAMVKAIYWFMAFAFLLAVIGFVNEWLTKNNSNIVQKSEQTLESVPSQNDYVTTEVESVILMPKIKKYNEEPVFGKISPTSTESSLVKNKRLTGTLYEDDFDKIRPETMIGDTDKNKEFRGFISFDISHIPLKIDTAELYLEPYASGDMNTKYFNPLLMEAIYIGDFLDKTHFNSKEIIGKTHEIFFKDIGRKPHNVTQEINQFLKDGRDFATFRFRFRERTDSNNKQDKLTIINDGCKTMLLIRHKPVN